MGKRISKDHLAVRESLRMIEGERLRSIPRHELAEMAGVDERLVAAFVRDDLWDGLHRLPEVLGTFDQDGRPAEDVLASAVERNPYPMWVTISRDFREAMFGHLTVERLKSLIHRAMRKQALERGNKREVLSAVSKASPALAAALGESTKALGSGHP